MKYEIKIIRCESHSAQETLNKKASAGWQLVSCWPEKGDLVAVFQRPHPEEIDSPTVSKPIAEPRIASSPATGSVPDTVSPLSLANVLSELVKAPVNKNSGAHYMKTGDVASLKQLGLKEGEENAIISGGYKVWLFNGKSACFVNARRA